MDATKIHALGTGDRELFDSLIQEYYPRLMGYACILLDDEAARDVVQDVFLYVWEHRSRFDFFHPGFRPIFSGHAIPAC